MIYVKPDFFDDFKCICGECTDNCCIGWEIDVDDSTYHNYCSMDTPFSQKIKDNIVTSPDGSRCFKLSEGERCPFLNKDNLCDIIINCGEAAICDICREHPRFYEWFPGVTECGLGLSCEAACKLLLEGENMFKLTEYNDGEKIALETKEEVIESDTYILTSALRLSFFEILSNKGLSLEDKIVKIIEKTQAFTGEDIKIKSDVRLVEAYEETEPIDDCWVKFLNDLKSALQDITNTELLWNDKECNELYSRTLAYIIYRHFIKSVFDNSFAERVVFCIESLRFIMLTDAKKLKEKGTLTIEDRVNSIKNWSKQIEYSDENTELLIYGDIL